MIETIDTTCQSLTRRSQIWHISATTMSVISRVVTLAEWYSKVEFLYADHLICDQDWSLVIIVAGEANHLSKLQITLK